MTQRASDFLRNWTAEYVSAVAYPEKKGEGEQLAQKCQSEAEAKGIPLDELEEAPSSDLVSYMFDALTDAAALEVGRSVTKDPF